jgi:hypothetical protein
LKPTEFRAARKARRVAAKKVVERRVVVTRAIELLCIRHIFVSLVVPHLPVDVVVL